jgi:hypothetical protein
MPSFGLVAINIHVNDIQHVEVVLGSFELGQVLEGSEEELMEELSAGVFGVAVQEVILFLDGLMHELKINLQFYKRCAVVISEQHAFPHDTLKLMILTRHYSQAEN